MPFENDTVLNEHHNAALCVFATGRYLKFIPDLVATAREHFLPDLCPSIVVFSNRYANNVDHNFFVPWLPWPLGSLLRYHFLVTQAPFLRGQYQYIFMCDADMRFVGPVGREILGRLVAALYDPLGPQPTSLALPFCRDPNSASYVSPDHDGRYMVGGFQGGESDAYLDACAALSDMVAQDLAQGIIAPWHDESYWNAYLVAHPPDIVLSTAYCTREQHQDENTKLVALVKDHTSYRRLQA
jgi:hypothetical protein